MLKLLFHKMKKNKPENLREGYYWYKEKNKSDKYWAICQIFIPKTLNERDDWVVEDLCFSSFGEITQKVNSEYIKKYIVFGERIERPYD